MFENQGGAKRYSKIPNGRPTDTFSNVPCFPLFLPSME